MLCIMENAKCLKVGDDITKKDMLVIDYGGEGYRPII